MKQPNLILTADADFGQLAMEELEKAIPGREIHPPLTPGIWPVALPNDFWELAERWRKHPPIFARHICPVHYTITQPTLPALRQATLSFLDLIDPSLTFSIQTRLLTETPYKPFNVNTAIAEIITSRTPARLNVRQPQQILSVVIGNQNGELTAFMGLSLALHNLSDWAGGVRRFKREPGQISRAEFKLLEALESFGITLPPRGVALDLGASPGGWTRVLRNRDQYVTAVDPAGLHPTLAQDPNVRHKRTTAEEYLAQYPDTYDLIVNDMRLDARDSARLMVSYARYIYRHGFALITLKLPHDNREPALDHSFNILRHTYTIENARNLFHNRSEVTVYLKKKIRRDSQS